MNIVYEIITISTMILCGLNVDNEETLLIYTDLAEESYNLFIFPMCFFIVLIVHCFEFEFLETKSCTRRVSNCNFKLKSSFGYSFNLSNNP